MPSGVNGAKGADCEELDTAERGCNPVCSVSVIGLDRVREAAKRDRKLRFNNLLHHITPSLLYQAYFALKRSAASGIDNISWHAYGEGNLSEKLQQLHGQLHAGTYKPQPSKRIWIQKDDGSQRPIGIACVRDKIVQQALVWVLEAIFEVDFKGFSYGFRPRRSQHNALDAVYMAITTKRVSWVLDADIKGFYDNIAHDWLMRFLGERVADKRVMALCEKMLRAGVVDDMGFAKTEKGAAQGSVISPFFANVYLHFVLDLWVHQWRNRHCRGECYIVRYADDTVMCLQYKSDGENLRRALGCRLEGFGLQLNESKTHLVEFGRYARLNRVQRGVGKPEVFNFLGFTHICGTRRLDKSFMLKRTTQKSKMRKKIMEIKQQLRKMRSTHIREQVAWVRSIIVGHANYYGVPGNSYALGQFRKWVCQAWFKSLRRRSQKARSLSWDKMRKFIASVIPSVRTVHPYPSTRFGV